MEQLTVIELIAYFFFKFIEDNIYAHTNFLSPREAYIKPKRLRSDIYRPNVLRYMITVGSWEHRPPAEKADDAFILSLLRSHLKTIVPQMRSQIFRQIV